MGNSLTSMLGLSFFSLAFESPITSNKLTFSFWFLEIRKEKLFTFHPSLLSVAMINTMANNNLGKERIYFYYISMSQSIFNDYKDKKIRHELVTDVMGKWLTLWLSLCLFPTLCSASFLIHPQLSWLGMVLSTKLNTKDHTKLTSIMSYFPLRHHKQSLPYLHFLQNVFHIISKTILIYKGKWLIAVFSRALIQTFLGIHKSKCSHMMFKCTWDHIVSGIFNLTFQISLDCKYLYV